MAGISSASLNGRTIRSLSGSVERSPQWPCHNNFAHRVLVVVVLFFFVASLNTYSNIFKSLKFGVCPLDITIVYKCMDCGSLKVRPPRIFNCLHTLFLCSSSFRINQQLISNPACQCRMVLDSRGEPGSKERGYISVNKLLLTMKNVCFVVATKISLTFFFFCALWSFVVAKWKTNDDKIPINY